MPRWLVACCCALSLALAGACDRDEPLPKLAELPAFELTDQEGEPFRLEDMRGKVWIADFVFTRCPSICPRLTERMHAMQERFRARRGEVGLVSFTVDPANDTPEVLRAYAERHDADPRMWTWVTGSTLAVSDVVVRGFKLAIGEPVPIGEEGQYDIMHSAHLVLVDRQGVVRGYYPSAEPEAMEKLEKDVARLLEEAR